MNMSLQQNFATCSYPVLQVGRFPAYEVTGPFKVAIALTIIASANFNPSQANATPYSQLVVFGDSNVDNGNLFRAIGVPGAPYYQGRFSNGPVVVEDGAQRLGIPLVDYAYGGATTGAGVSVGSFVIPSVLTQINSYSASLNGM